ncbi:MAG: hypothetical protein ABW252_15795 [Polyangiales bacterium]
MRFRVFSLAGTLLLSATLSACTNLLDIDELGRGSADGGSVPPADGAAPEGGRGTPPAMGSDVNAFAPRQTIDAGTSLAESADPPSFACDAGPTAFCDDFEAADLSRWSELTTAPAGGSSGVVLAPHDVAGRGKSLLASVPESALALASLAYVRKTLTSVERGPVDVRVELDLKVEQHDLRADHSAVVLNLRFDADEQGVNQYVLGVHPLPSGRIALRLFESVRPTPAGPLQLGFTAELGEHDAGRWLHVVYALHLPAPAGASVGAMQASNRIAIRVDATEALPSRPLTLPLRGHRPQLDVGISWLEAREGHATWRVRYDNVRVHAAPL